MAHFTFTLPLISATYEKSTPVDYIEFAFDETPPAPLVEALLARRVRANDLGAASSFDSPPQTIAQYRGKRYPWAEDPNSGGDQFGSQGSRNAVWPHKDWVKAHMVAMKKAPTVSVRVRVCRMENVDPLARRSPFGPKGVLAHMGFLRVVEVKPGSEYRGEIPLVFVPETDTEVVPFRYNFVPDEGHPVLGALLTDSGWEEVFSVPGQSQDEVILYGRRLQNGDGKLVRDGYRFGGIDYLQAEHQLRGARSGDVARVYSGRAVARYFVKK